MEQPDFRDISDHLHRAGDGLRRCENLPGVADGQAIAQALGALNDQLVQIRNAIEQIGNRLDGLENRFDVLENRFDVLENRFDVLENRFDGLENRFDAFTREARARDQNASSRLYNSIVVTVRDIPLSPLYSLVTGQIIPNFPATIRQINELDEEVVDGIFRHLYQEMQGQDVWGKRLMLRSICGLVRA